MKKTINRYIALSLIAFSSISIAETSSSMITSKQLLESCSSKLIENNNLCAGYIAGNIDTLVSLAGSEIIEHAVCVPPNVLISSLADRIIIYLNKHPEELSLNASSVILEVLMDALPCS